jgi:hypothetical protein
MIPVGYMSKRLAEKPEWLKAENVIDIYSLSTVFPMIFAITLSIGNTTAIGCSIRQKR